MTWGSALSTRSKRGGTKRRLDRSDVGGKNRIALADVEDAGGLPGRRPGFGMMEGRVVRINHGSGSGGGGRAGAV